MLSRKPLGGARGIALLLSTIAGVVLWGARPVQAAPQNGLTPTDTLQDLINLNSTGGVQIGHLIFSDFSYSGNGGTNPAPSASLINVVTSPYTGTGLEFVASWEGFTGGDQESLISYAVQAAPGFALTEVQLDFNGAAPVPSPGTKASVTETVSTLNTSTTPPSAGSPISQLTVVNTQATGNVGPQTILDSTLALNPHQTGIFVQKDIQLNGGTAGVSTISFVANTYQIVPEPVGGCLVGTMALGLMVRRRRF